MHHSHLRASVPGPPTKQPACQRYTPPNILWLRPRLTTRCALGPSVYSVYRCFTHLLCWHVDCCRPQHKPCHDYFSLFFTSLHLFFIFFCPLLTPCPAVGYGQTEFPLLSRIRREERLSAQIGLDAQCWTCRLIGVTQNNGMAGARRWDSATRGHPEPGHLRSGSVSVPDERKT